MKTRGKGGDKVQMMLKRSKVKNKKMALTDTSQKSFFDFCGTSTAGALELRVSAAWVQGLALIAGPDSGCKLLLFTS